MRDVCHLAMMGFVFCAFMGVMKLFSAQFFDERSFDALLASRSSLATDAEKYRQISESVVMRAKGSDARSDSLHMLTTGFFFLFIAARARKKSKEEQVV